METTIIKDEKNKLLKVNMSGRLDTSTSPLLEEQIADKFDGIENIEIDLKSLEYISSAGLRVLLAMKKKLPVDGELIIKNAKKEILEIFEITGFDSVLTIDRKESKNV